MLQSPRMGHTQCARDDDEAGLTDDILQVVLRTAGVDFSGYRAQTVERRIRNRMMALGIDDLSTYHRFLRESADEVQSLIARLTIKVSRFYRNPQVFDAIRSEVLPRLAQLGRPVRVWSAGCARGEEAFTLAMLLEEAAIPGEVIATDIDPLALQVAREARFEAGLVSDLPSEWTTRFLEPIGHRAQTVYHVREAIRTRVAFEHADLTTASSNGTLPFDLICCRNALIYWNADVQRTIFGHLLSSLHQGGWLCLGEAEWPDRASLSRLDVVAARLRLFRHRTTESPQ